jgi:hypothetical protein
MAFNQDHDHTEPYSVGFWALCCRLQGVFTTVTQTGPLFLLCRLSEPRLTTATTIKSPFPWWKRLISRSGLKPLPAATSWKGKVDPWWCISPCLTKTTVEVGPWGTAGYRLTGTDQTGRLWYTQGMPGLPSNMWRARESKQKAFVLSTLLTPGWDVMLSVSILDVSVCL